ncbi:MAG: class I SAM-dependent methyltransferase [Deltaproteobacteria bacterium]|nr:class I SAM-dependent methyltransferase [Deltaproteobacteria bacterium]
MRQAPGGLRSAKRRERALVEGTEAHYRDAGYYTANYRERVEDIDYYLELCLERGGRVLEYGCGNGRIALPLANAGLDVTGVDCSAEMLDDLRQRLKRGRPEVARRVRLRRGDMRAVRLPSRFDLVLCTFNTFLHLYTRQDVERFLARVRAHLAPRGRFVVDVSMPMAEELARDPERLFRAPRFRHATTGDLVRYGERFRYDPLRQVQLVDMVFEPIDEPSRAWVTPLAHRQFFPQELEALLHYNGLDVVEIHGDYERRAPTQEATTLVYHCERAR